MSQKGESLYSFWALFVFLAMALIAVGVLSCSGMRTFTESPPAPAASPEPPEMLSMSPEEVKTKLDAGSNIAIVDVRTKPQYEREHIPGAISMPLADINLLEDIDRNYSQLRSYDEIITYCA